VLARRNSSRAPVLRTGSVIFICAYAVILCLLFIVTGCATMPPPPKEVINALCGLHNSREMQTLCELGVIK
jgi:hypothetical protein